MLNLLVSPEGRRNVQLVTCNLYHIPYPNEGIITMGLHTVQNTARNYCSNLP